MAENIEKLDPNAFVDSEGDVRTPADVQVLEGVDTDRMVSSRDRADKKIKAKRERDLEPSDEDIAQADADFLREQVHFDRDPGVTLSLKKRAKAMTKIARYYEESENLKDMDADAQSFRTNKFNQAYTKDEMKRRLEQAENHFLDGKETYDDAINSLSKTKQLLERGFTADELQVAQASRVDIRNAVEQLRKKGPLYEGRLELINALRESVGLEPIEATFPEHLTREFTPKPFAPPEQEEKSGCDCNCQTCNLGGGLHCHNDRSGCYI